MAQNYINPLISILIPTYNRETLIGETIDSALSQTYQNIELIIVDNNSDDKTAEVVKSYQARDGRIKFFQNEKNLGPVLNWEKCLNQASGVYSKILWSDDLIRPKFLESCLDLFAIEKDLAFVFSKAVIGTDTSDPSFPEFYGYFEKTGIYNSSEFVRGILADKNLPVSPGCAIFKTEVLKKSFIKTNELFENKYLQNGAGPDLLMFLMATNIHKKIGYVDSALCFFRAHPNSISIIEDGNLFVFYKKAVIWFIYHHISANLANAYFLKVQNSLRKNQDRKISESFEMRQEYIKNNFMVSFYYLEIPLFGSKFFKRSIKFIYWLIPLKKVRHKIRNFFL